MSVRLTADAVPGRAQAAPDGSPLKSEPIPRETFERIAVRRAPSGGFSQGQRLLVVDDPMLLAEMAEGDTDARYRKLLRIQDDFAIVAGVTLGRALHDPAWSTATSRATQRRRSVDELVHWNVWQA